MLDVLVAEYAVDIKEPDRSRTAGRTGCELEHAA